MVKFDTIVKTVTLIHHIIWTIIGLLILIAVYFMITVGFKQLGALATPNQAQTAGATSQPQLSEKEVKCIEDSLGTKRFEEISAGATPSPDEQTKLMGCFQTQK